MPENATVKTAGRRWAPLTVAVALAVAVIVGYVIEPSLLGGLAGILAR